MIQANEFRRGNLVQDTFKNIHPIQWIDNTGIETEYGRFPFDRVSPIPITPEWLERLGFKEIDIWFEKRNRNGSVIMVDKPNMTVCADSQGSYSEQVADLKHIKYVHQLQNLYHALTGNELKIK